MIWPPDGMPVALRPGFPNHRPDAVRRVDQLVCADFLQVGRMCRMNNGCLICRTRGESTRSQVAQLLANIDAGALDVDEVLWAYNMLTEELDAWRNGRGLCVTGRAVRGRRARRRRR